MNYVIEDFVNRELYLEHLWKSVRQESSKRLLLIPGVQGLGKSYLLEEYQAECDARGTACVRIDFREKSNHTYLGIIRIIRLQLGASYFVRLDQEVDTLDYARHPASYSPPSPFPPLPASSGEAVQRSGGIDFSNSAQVGRDVAGRDIVTVFQNIYQDDKQVQEDARERITEVLQRCLISLTTQRAVAFLFDAWELAPPLTQEWLCSTIFDWVLEKKLPGGIVAVAGAYVPDIGRLHVRIESLELAGLPEEAVRVYWVEKRGLPLEEVPNVVRLTRGKPSAVALLADIQSVPIGLRTHA